MPRKKKNIKDFVNAISDFITGESPEGLRVFRYNKNGKLVEVINNLELIKE